MPFARPSLTELVDRVSTDIASRLVVVEGAVLRRSLIGILGRTEAGAVHLLYGYLDWISKQCIPDTAESEYLERWAAIWGIKRKPATFAVGQVGAVASQPATLFAGTIWQRSDGFQYETVANQDIPAGTTPIDLLALVAGTASNTPAGVGLTLLSPVAGVQSSGLTLGEGIRSGTDQESDEELLARLLQRIQQPPQGGAESDYILWALEVPGVTRVWVYPNGMGAGTVVVLFVTDNDPAGPIPDAATVAEVQAHIDSVKPVTAEVFVAAPIAQPINFSIKLSPNNATVRANVTAELEDLLYREAEPNGTLLISHIREAVSIAAGEVNNEVTVPAADVVTTGGHMAIMGTITFSSFVSGEI
jgi:uncharacterized phage protein gp47/JayE